MSWRDGLRAANFRGATFFVDSHELEGGQRLSVHEFPQRQEPLVHWLGRKAVTYRITGYLLGDGYMRDRDRLIEACQKVPPGFPRRISSTLIHPYLGRLRVICTGIRVRETRAEGRMATVEMAFMEGGREPEPAQTKSQGQLVGKAEAATADVEAAATGDLVESLEVEGVAELAREAVSTKLTKLGQAIESLDVFTGPANDVAALAAKTAAVIGKAAELATAPASLAAEVIAAVGLIKGAVSTAAGALFAYETLLGLSGDAPPGVPTSTLGQQVAGNEATTLDFIKISAAGGAVQAAISAAWETQEDAEAARDRLTDQIDDLLLRARDDVYPALQELRTVLVAGVPPPGEQLPSVETLTLPGNLPSLVLAYRLYDGTGREGELVRRNRIAHPLFLPGQTPLEVLSA